MRVRLFNLWSRLLVPEKPARYLGIATLFDVPLSLAITGLISLAPGSQNPTFPGYSLFTIAWVMCLAVPAVETLILVAVVELLRVIVRSFWGTVCLTALLAAVLHSLSTPLWGILIAWTFFVQSLAYLTWRSHGWWRAYGLTMAVHAIHNLTATALLAVQRAFTAT